MANTIKLKRGIKSRLPRLEYGEPAYVSDEGELYIGSESGNVKLTNKSEIDVINVQIDTIEKEKLNYITPEMFGAIGDGVHDDYKALREMFDYIDKNSDNISIGGTQEIKDYGKFNIIFNGKYSISQSLILSSCYNLKLNNLYLTGTNNFSGDYLLISEGIFRNSSFNNCIFDGNNWTISCVSLLSSTLNNRFDNCVFRKFKNFGLSTNENNGHELIFSNCKFNQYEWGDSNEGILPQDIGIGLYIGENVHDNNIINCTFAYCTGSALKIKSVSNFISNCHIYSPDKDNNYAVEILGQNNNIGNCFFDYATLVMGGYSTVHDNIFMNDKTFILLNGNIGDFSTSIIKGNMFKGKDGGQVSESIKGISFIINKTFMNIYDNTFQNSVSTYALSSSYNPNPFNRFSEEQSSTKGYQIVGNIKYMWGYCTVGVTQTLDCTRLLNVQAISNKSGNTLYLQNMSGNQFIIGGTGECYYFAVGVV